MKRHSLHSGTCSCTTCAYRSHSKLPSVQKLIEEGSKIDRLFYGKFLPLRERKLLEKLIETRDVYDNVRTQLLSTSGSSIHGRSEHKTRRRDDECNEKNCAVLKMVDLVDRGQIGSPKSSKLSSCCSCCSCSFMRKIRKHMDKRPDPVHRLNIPCEEITKYCEEAAKKGEKRRHRLSTKISSRVRSVRFKMKKIRSTPCVCPHSLTKMIKGSSKSLLLKESIITSTHKVIRNEKKGLAKKICLCSGKVAKLPMKSIRKIKNMKKTSTTKSSATDMGNQRNLIIRKDSLTLFREKLHKRKAMKDWECERNTCVVGESIPEECLKKIKARKVGERKCKRYHSRISGPRRDRSRITMSTHPRKIKKTDSGMQVSPKSNKGECECKPTLKNASSMTSLAKSKPSKIISEIITENCKVPKPKYEKVYKTKRYKTKKTNSEKLAEIETKSTSSMTTFPKSRGLKPIAKKEIKMTRPVPAKPRQQYVLQDAWEREVVKPPMKSTPSMISVKNSDHLLRKPKHEKIHKTARYKPRQDYKTDAKYKTVTKTKTDISDKTDAMREIEGSGKQAVKISSSFKFEIEFSKEQYPDLTSNEVIEHVKHKRARDHKPRHGLREHHIKHRHSKIQVSKSNRELSYLRESASQASDDTRKMVLPCESSMCIPYECDRNNGPYTSSKSRSRSVLSSTGRYRRKSQGSTTSSLRNRSKSRYAQSEQTRFRREKELQPQKIEKESSHQQKQVVKIGSNFSFNIEFYKENSPDTIIDEKQDLQYNVPKENKQYTNRKRINKETVYRPAKRPVMRHTSSQSRSSQSVKTVQVKHKLKRCFCTLKLLQKKKQRVRPVVSKRTMATYTDKCEQAARLRATQTSKKPDVLIFRNSISVRNSSCDCGGRKSLSIDTNTDRAQKRSTPTITSQDVCEASCRKIQSSERRHRKHKIKRSYTPKVKVETVDVSDTSTRQAVRIGSTFSFNIEFSKENIGQEGTYEKEITKFSEPSSETIKEKKQVRHRGVKVHKPCICHVVSETPRNIQTKKINTTPFLHRCFCTLKLLNKNMKQAATATPLTNQNDNIYLESKSIATTRPDKRYGSCDPYECERILRRIKLQHKHMNTGSIRTRSTYSGTETITSSKSRNTQSYYEGSRDKTKRFKTSHREPKQTYESPRGSNRQAVRVGSSFSFNVEFYKENITDENNKEIVEVIRTSSPNRPRRKHDYTEPKVKQICTQPCSPHFRHKALHTEAKRKEKGMYVGSAIKRCFCTLKLHKKGKDAREQDKNVDHTKSVDASHQLKNPEIFGCKSTNTSHKISPPQICDCKSTKTSSKLPQNQICNCKSSSTKKLKPIYDLDSPPGLCVPGTCDPYECYEEMKRRGTRLQDRYMNTQRLKRITSLTTTEVSGSSKAKSTQSRYVKEIPKQHHKVKEIEEIIRPAQSFLPARQAVHIGSNFNFNIEFFKDRNESPIHDMTYKTQAVDYNTLSDATMAKKIKHKGTYAKRPALHHHRSQASNITKKENKGSNVGFMLKRCFCTLGLQKRNIAKRKPIREYYGDQSITTQLLQVAQVNSNWPQSLKYPNTQNKQELELVNGHHFFKPRISAPMKAMNDNQCLPLKPQTSSYPLKKENISVFKKRSSFMKSAFFRPRKNFNMFNRKSTQQTTNSNLSSYDKRQIGYFLNNIQKVNPFYQSFCAFQLSNLNHLEDNKCEPGVCIPYECDSVECLRRINSRMRHSRSSGTERLRTKSVTSMASSRVQRRHKTTEAHQKIFKRRLSQDNGSLQISHPSRQVIKVGSDFNFSMEFYKGTALRQGDNKKVSVDRPKRLRNTGTRSLRTRFRHTDSQITARRHSKGTGTSPLLKRSFETLKSKKKSDESKHSDKTVNVSIDHMPSPNQSIYNHQSTMTTHPYGSIVLNENRSIMTDKLEPYECPPNICVPGECDPHECYKLIRQRTQKFRNYAVGTDYPKHKSTSSLGTSYTRHMKTKPVQSGHYVSKKRAFENPAKAKARSKVSQFNKASGDNTKRTRSQGHTVESKIKMKNAGNNVTHRLTKCFCTSKIAKKGSKHINKSIQQQEENHNKKTQSVVTKSNATGDTSKLEPHRRVRSKNTKVKREKQAATVKSAVMDKSTATKGKRVSKSFECKPHVCKPGKCDPHECLKRLKAQGVVIPKLDKIKVKNVQQEQDKNVKKVQGKNAKQTQIDNYKTKSINTDKQKKSLLTKCFCVLSLLKSKQPSGKVNKKSFKGGKERSPKQNTEITTTNKKPDLKLEKKKGNKKKDKAKHKKEMETLMPYSKKKFKKHDSQTKLAQIATNTVGKYPCNCPPAQMKHGVPTANKKSGLSPVRFPNKNQGANTTLNSSIRPGICLVCEANQKAARKAQGKQQQGTNIIDGQTKKGKNKDGHANLNAQERRNNNKENRHNIKPARQHYDKMSDLCPVCQAVENAKFKSEKNDIQSIESVAKEKNKSSIFNIILEYICSSLMGRKKKETSQLSHRKLNKPLFEMIVNRSSMHVKNRLEVLANLDSRGKESSAMKQAKIAAQKGKVHPVMELLIEKDSANIINSDEILNKMIPFEERNRKAASKKASVKHTKSERKSRPHDSRCGCCECRRKGRGGDGKKDKAVLTTGKEAGNVAGQEAGAKQKVKPRKLKPCVCGSIVCKKDWEKLKRESMKIKKFKIKPCVCGSEVCEMESQKKLAKLQEAHEKHELAEEIMRQKNEAEQVYQHERLNRKKHYLIEDAKRWNRRKIKDKRDMKYVEKYVNVPDYLAVTESLTDLGKFSGKALVDLLRAMSRVIRHPRDGIYNIKDAYKNPQYAAQQMKKSCEGMGFFATMARIRKRLSRMKTTQAVVTRMVPHSAINFVLHRADKDSTKRMKKFKQKRRREDLECSIFIATLRKRPCLRVYYMCPWFYPHCVKTLTVWKQFTNIILFILAVGVWSPCILAMELCRAFMCCCF